MAEQNPLGPSYLAVGDARKLCQLGADFLDLMETAAPDDEAKYQESLEFVRGPLTQLAAELVAHDERDSLLRRGESNGQ